MARSTATRARRRTPAPTATHTSAPASGAGGGGEGPRLRTVPVGDIAASPDNTRLFDTADAEERAALEELAASIREVGLQQHPKVRPNEPGAIPPFVLVYGERRLRAVRDILGWDRVTVLVDDGLTEADAAEATVVENLQRRDLHPMDEARGLAILRRRGLSTTTIAAHLGRREAWIKERLKLCALPEDAQDLYRRSASMTLGQAQDLHDYTHGGRDNTGFPALIVAIAREMAAGMGGSPALGGFVHRHPDLVREIAHGYGDGQGRWGGHFFDTRQVCTHCPFAAYRPGYYDGVGYCLMPTHYEELKAKGKATYAAAQAALQAEAEAARAAGGATPHPAPTWQASSVKTAAEKGQETRKRHQDQRAAYGPNVAAIERTIDMIPAVDTVDLAVTCAYVLTSAHVVNEAVEQVIKRHELKGFPAPQATPGRAMIERLRSVEGVALMRYTLEALLLTQAMRARDYDPGRTPAEPVLALYLPGQAISSPTSVGEEGPPVAAEEGGLDAVVEEELIDDGTEGAA